MPTLALYDRGALTNRTGLLERNWQGPSGQFRGPCEAYTGTPIGWGRQGYGPFAGAPATPLVLQARQQFLRFRGDTDRLPTLILERALLVAMINISAEHRFIYGLCRRECRGESYNMMYTQNIHHGGIICNMRA
jgi:hypothetical protein